MADIPESTKSEHVVWTVDATSYLRNLNVEDLLAETIAVHYQAPPEKTPTGTRISLCFPTLIVSGYCSEPREVADRVARILNAHWDEPAAPPAMDREAVVQLKGDDQDPYSFSGDEDENGFVISQHRFYKWGEDCIIAVGELNAPNTWDDEAFDAKCQTLLSTLSADAIRQGEGATARNCRVVGSDLWRHVKRGTVYEVIGTAELQASQPQLEHAELVIYQGADGKLWARNSAEFHDGRFVTATPASHASDGGKA